MKSETENKLLLGVLGSGKGSNLAAILEAINEGSLSARVLLVISDQPDSGILDIAREAEIETIVIEPESAKAKLPAETEEKYAAALTKAGVDIVVLAGFMRVLTGPLLEAFPERILNIHPSLLPKYPGLEAWKQALEAGEKLTGCTVHHVTKEVDGGPVVAQGEVDVFEDDTPETLHNRIQRTEHILYPMVLDHFARLKATA